MQKDLVFFKKEGEEGIGLTSTSANHIANMAKEYIQGIETVLDNISFLNVDMALISGTPNVIQIGATKSDIDKIPQALGEIAKAKSLVAWLREAIKAKESLVNSLQAADFETWCEENGKEYPTPPKAPHVLTEPEYYAALSIKERNRYYQLETEAAVLGKYIHPNGQLSNARKELKDKVQHPHKVDGKGRDALIYSYAPSAEVVEVDNMFYELQKKHREVQAQLNSMKHDCEVARNLSLNESNTKHSVAMEEYRGKLQSLMLEFKTWKDIKTQEYSKLKIAVPDSLMGIYNIVNSLGK